MSNKIMFAGTPGTLQSNSSDAIVEPDYGCEAGFLWPRYEIGMYDTYYTRIVALENELTQLNIPEVDFVKVYLSAAPLAAALDSDGNLWTWGRNKWGSLGQGIDDDRQGNKAPAIALTNIKEAVFSDRTMWDASGEYNYTHALDNEGNVWGWGENVGTQSNEPTPYIIATDVLSFSAYDTSVGYAAVKTNGYLVYTKQYEDPTLEIRAGEDIGDGLWTKIYSVTNETIVALNANGKLYQANTYNNPLSFTELSISSQYFGTELWPPIDITEGLYYTLTGDSRVMLTEVTYALMADGSVQESYYITDSFSPRETDVKFKAMSGTSFISEDGDAYATCSYSQNQYCEFGRTEAGGEQETVRWGYNAKGFPIVYAETPTTYTQDYNDDPRPPGYEASVGETVVALNPKIMHFTGTEPGDIILVQKGNFIDVAALAKYKTMYIAGPYTNKTHFWTDLLDLQETGSTESSYDPYDVPGVEEWLYEDTEVYESV